jgi:hypothetical protein
MSKHSIIHHRQRCLDLITKLPFEAVGLNTLSILIQSTLTQIEDFCVYNKTSTMGISIAIACNNHITIYVTIA